MGKIEQFSLALSKSDRNYKSGEVLFGTIRLKINERLKIKSLTIKVVGEGNVQWY